MLFIMIMRYQITYKQRYKSGTKCVIISVFSRNMFFDVFSIQM